MNTSVAAIKLLTFMVLTTLATGLLALAISNSQFVPQAKYDAIFTDATGLLKGDEVRIAGVRVGTVDEIKLHNGRLAKVRLEVDRKRRLPRNVQAQIRYRNLQGQRYVSLTQGKEGPAGDLPVNGRGVIPQSQTTPGLDLTALFNGFRPLFKALDPKEVNELAQQIVQVLQGEGGTVTGLLAHVGSLTNTIADRDVVIGRVIDNLNQVVGALDDRDKQVASLISQMKSFVSGLASDRTAIGNSLVSINKLVDTTDSLLTDVRPTVKSDISEFRKLSKTLANSDEELELLLRRTPRTLEAVNRASSYGSWINFYLCSLDATIQLPGGTSFTTPRIQNEQPRCKP